MGVMRRALVVVPAWNEEGSVGEVVKEVDAALPEIEVLVVDDGSSDRTAELARAAGAEVMSLPFNLGVGGAMRAGFRYADRHQYDAAVQVDADGQHDPHEIPLLLERLDEANVVIGARFAGKGDYPVKGARKWAMWLLSRCVSRMVGVQVTDATSGFRAYDRRAVKLFSRHYPAEYLGDTVESLVIAARAGLQVAQVPVRMRPRMAGMPTQSAWKAAAYLGRACLVLVLAFVRRWPDVAGRDATRRDEPL